ncbi:MAG: 16S rRNA methyltransferase, partial [Chloroflexota bacterium]|nr:16S rRNA methyltransferase [Chloroflexota bacterium]
LAIPWMPLMPGARYLAIDVLDDLARFYDDALPLLGVDGRGLSRDVSREGVFDDLGQFDVALVIKALPCLAQIDRTAPARLLQSIPARVLIVSYPVRSLSGESKGMRGHYAESLAQLTADQPWTVERFDFADELAFRITKADRQPA